MSKANKGRGLFIFLCIIAFLLSFVGSAIFKITYTPREMRKYTVKWSDEIGKAYPDLSYRISSCGRIHIRR